MVQYLGKISSGQLINNEHISDWEIGNVEYELREVLVKKFSILHDVSDVLLFTNSGRKINAYGDKSFKLKFKKDFLDTYLEQLVEKNGTPVWKGLNQDIEERLVKFATSPEQMNKSVVLTYQVILV